MRVWSTSTGKLLKLLKGHTESVRSVTLSSNDNQIISGSEDGTVRVWDAWTGRVLMVLNGHTGWVNSIALSSDMSRIVSGSEDRSIRVWDGSSISRYLRQRKDRDHTGWILSPSGQDLFMFVPLDTNLPDSQNILTIPSSASSSVDFSRAKLGLEWTDCYIPG